MKHPYTIHYQEIGSILFPAIQLPHGLEAITSFLLSDVQAPIIDYYLSALDDVLQDRMPYQEAGGNVFRLEIRKDLTRVIDTLDNNEATDTCVIETNELRELIEIWSELHPIPVEQSSHR